MSMYVAEPMLWKKGWSSLVFLRGRDHSQATPCETGGQNVWTCALSFLSYANNYPPYKMLLLATYLILSAIFIYIHPVATVTI